MVGFLQFVKHTSLRVTECCRMFDADTLASSVSVTTTANIITRKLHKLASIKCYPSLLKAFGIGILIVTAKN